MEGEGQLAPCLNYSKILALLIVGMYYVREVDITIKTIHHYQLFEKKM